MSTFYFYFHPDGVVLHVMSLRDHGLSLAHRGGTGKDQSCSYLDAQLDGTRTYRIIRQIKKADPRRE